MPPPRVYHGLAAQISHGIEINDVYDTTLAAIAEGTITKAGAFTAGRYDGQFLVFLTGNAQNKVYYVTTNTADVINVQPATMVTDGAAAGNRVALHRYGVQPAATAAQFGVIPPTATLPDPDTAPEDYWHIASGRERYTTSRGMHKLQGSIEGPLQTPLLIAFALGKEVTVGTDVGGGGGSQLDGAVKAGDNIIKLDSVANYAVNDYVQVGPNASAEVRKITAVDAVGLTLTLDVPLRQNHTDNDACNEVTSPYTHTLSVDEDGPSFTIETVFKNITDFIRYYRGCKVDELELSCEPGKALMASATVKAKKQVKGTTKSTITLDSTAPYLWNNAAVTFGGVSMARVTKMTWKPVNGYEELGALQNTPTGDGLFLVDLVPKKVKSTWSMTVAPFDTTLWDNLVGASTFTGQVVFTRGASDTLTLTVAGIRIKTAPHNIPEEGAVSVDLTGDGSTVTATAVDSTPYYI